MICLICRQAEIVDGLISVHFMRQETDLTVNQIPAHVCPGCGEGYVDERVATSLLLGAEKIYQAGFMENNCNYQELIVQSQLDDR